MPKMSGKELAQHLLESRPETKVLYMSGYSENLVSHQGILDAGVALIEKPFAEESLLQRVRNPRRLPQHKVRRSHMRIACVKKGLNRDGEGPGGRR